MNALYLLNKINNPEMDAFPLLLLFFFFSKKYANTN